MLSRQLFDPAVASHADTDRLLRAESQVHSTPFVLNNHSNGFKSHCTFPLGCLQRSSDLRTRPDPVAPFATIEG
jgi:hypothetical protein